MRTAIVNISASTDERNTHRFHNVFQTWSCFRLSSSLASSFTDFLISCSIFSFLIDNLEHSHYQHERLATVVVAPFSSKFSRITSWTSSSESSITRQTLVNNALVASCSCPGSTLLHYHVWCVSHIVICAVLNCVRATHGLPADRAPVYRGYPYRDPLGSPLKPRQDGIRDKAPTLWLLLCCCNC